MDKPISTPPFDTDSTPQTALDGVGETTPEAPVEQAVIAMSSVSICSLKEQMMDRSSFPYIGEFVAPQEQ